MAVLLFNNKTGEIRVIKYPNKKENKEIINKLLNSGFKTTPKIDSTKTLNYHIFFCETHNRYEFLYYSYPRAFGTSFQKNVIFKAIDILKDCKYIAKKEEDEFISIENVSASIIQTSEPRFLSLIKQLKEYKEDGVLFSIINFLTAQYLAFSYAKNRMKVNPKLGQREIEIIKKRAKNGVLEEVRRMLEKIKDYYDNKLEFIAYEELDLLILKLYGLKLVDTNNYFNEVIDLIKKFLEEQESLIESFFDVSYYRQTSVKIIYKLTDDPRYLKYAL
jgi:transcription termination factor NusB